MLISVLSYHYTNGVHRMHVWDINLLSGHPTCVHPYVHKEGLIPNVHSKTCISSMSDRPGMRTPCTAVSSQEDVGTVGSNAIATQGCSVRGKTARDK